MKRIVVLLCIPYSLFGQIREIPRTDINDIAIASYDQHGPVIYYNPIISDQVGPVLSAFFRAHEYGHHYLGHIRREFFESNPYNKVWLRRVYEKEADCWASKNSTQQVRITAVQFFAKAHGNNRPTWLHPTGYERAKVILNCSFNKKPR